MHPAFVKFLYFYPNDLPGYFYHLQCCIKMDTGMKHSFAMTGLLLYFKEIINAMYS